MTPGGRVQAAIELLDEMAAAAAPADAVRDSYFRHRRYIGAKDRRAVSERIFRVVRHQARLDWWIRRRGGGLEPVPRLRVIADLALNEGAGAAPLAGLFDGARYAPGRLAADERALAQALAGEPLDHPAMPDWVRLEYPRWLDGSLRALWGERLAEEIAALNRPAAVDLRVNPLKASREEARAALEASGIAAAPTPLSPLGLRVEAPVRLMGSAAFRRGLIEIQDEGSQIVALLADARPGQAVLDFCAGAGGKTLALAAAMRNTGRLVACDIREGRIAGAARRLRRAGVHNVSRRVLAREGDRWLKRAAGSFDRVLADVPCTGTGTWRRNPDAKWRIAPADLEELTAVQDSILARAAPAVKPGGRLIYATCSVLAAENEERIAGFLAGHPGFAVLPVAAVWAATVGGRCPAGGPFLRLTPAAHGTDGFFCAILERRDR